MVYGQHTTGILYKYITLQADNSRCQYMIISVDFFVHEKHLISKLFAVKFSFFP